MDVFLNYSQEIAKLYDKRYLKKISDNTLYILIPEGNLEKLQGGDYKLCVIKKTNYGKIASCNIVWQSYSDFLGNTVLSWENEYYLFASLAFVLGDNINYFTTCRPVEIEIGQQSIIDGAGNLSSAVSYNGTDASGKNGITIVDEFKKHEIYPGLMQVYYNLERKAVCSPVSLINNCMTEKDSLTLCPTNEVYIGFSKSLESGDIIGELPNTFFKVEITGNKKSIQYGDEGWKLV